MNANEKKLSGRAVKAVAVLAAGGRFVKKLEGRYNTRGLVFVTRLYTAAGQVVKGCGDATRHELTHLLHCESRTGGAGNTWTIRPATLSPENAVRLDAVLEACA